MSYSVNHYVLEYVLSTVKCHFSIEMKMMPNPVWQKPWRRAHRRGRSLSDTVSATQSSLDSRNDRHYVITRAIWPHITVFQLKQLAGIWLVAFYAWPCAPPCGFVFIRNAQYANMLVLTSTIHTETYRSETHAHYWPNYIIWTCLYLPSGIVPVTLVDIVVPSNSPWLPLPVRVGHLCQLVWIFRCADHNIIAVMSHITITHTNKIEYIHSKLKNYLVLLRFLAMIT